MRVSEPPNPIIAGRYELVQAAGVGGMGTVWRAVAHGDSGFRRTVAIKRMLPFVVDDGSAEPDPAAQMFIEEARVVSELSHPNIVQVLDFCSDGDGRYVIVMEWVEGLDLSRLVKSFEGEPTPWPIVTAILIEVLKALHAAHRRRDKNGRLAPIYHRDVTPTNVIVGANGVSKLTDFGLARAMDRAEITPPGVLKGKLAYMAPEYVGGSDATPATDQYSAAVVLWEALAGRRLRTDTDPVKLYARVAQPIPRLDDQRGDLPDTLVDMVHEALNLDPAERFVSCRAMARALASVLRLQDVAVDDVTIGRCVRAARRRIGLPIDLPGDSRSTPTPTPTRP